MGKHEVKGRRRATPRSRPAGSSAPRKTAERTTRLRTSEGEPERVLKEVVTKRGAYVATLPGADTHITAIPEVHIESASASVSFHATRGDERSGRMTVDTRDFEAIAGGIVRRALNPADLWKLLPRNGLVTLIRGAEDREAIKSSFESTDPADPTLDLIPSLLLVCKRIVGYVDQVDPSTLALGDVVFVRCLADPVPLRAVLEWKPDAGAWVLFDISPILDLFNDLPSAGNLMAFNRAMTAPEEIIAAGKRMEERAARELGKNTEFQAAIERLRRLICEREPEALADLENQ